jgi:hypothetical protein
MSGLCGNGKRNRKRIRDYLIKAAYSTGSEDVQAMAHGIIIQWYLDATNPDTGVIRNRYLFAAAHHSNAAARLCSRLSSAADCGSPAVLWFMNKVFKLFVPQVPELKHWYKDAIRVFEAREVTYNRGTNKMAKKRIKNPIRYRCAAPGCDIEADTGSMLSSCESRTKFRRTLTELVDRRRPLRY